MAVIQSYTLFAKLRLIQVDKGVGEEGGGGGVGSGWVGNAGERWVSLPFPRQLTQFVKNMFNTSSPSFNYMLLLGYCAGIGSFSP